MRHDSYKFKIKPLKYRYNAYHPILCTESMQLHHGVHLQRYVDGLNIELDGYPNLQSFSIEELPAAARRLPKESSRQLMENLGGVFCHHTFFDLLIPPGILQTAPSEALKTAVITAFGSFESLFYNFKQLALGLEGSGWIWLLADSRGRLSLEAGRDNELPDLLSYRVVLLLDMWEHAYYLTYRCNKGAYIDGFFRIINWKIASENYERPLPRASASVSKKSSHKQANKSLK